MRDQVLVITGPTAVRKSEVAIAIADRLPSVLISMDSALVYRGMDIGTAKPSAQARAAHLHGLIDICDPADAYTAAQFVRDADAFVRQARAAGRLPVLVGGTMLYLRAFRDGLARLPEADAAVRAVLADEATASGWQALHRQLAEIDPRAAANIHVNNTQRLQRALEVYRITGRPISAFWEEQRDTAFDSRLGGRLAEFAIVPDERSALHRRIELRFRSMLDAGLMDEVRALQARDDLSLELPSMRAVGYRQVWECLEGQFDHSELAERGAAATRQLAKRQLTWLRSWPWIRMLTWDRPEHLAQEILRCCGGFLVAP
jgi:tRNA dimethylallyltransferase